MQKTIALSFIGITIKEFDDIYNKEITKRYHEYELKRLSKRKNRKRDIGAGRPFKLAEEDGSREFFETIGKVALILSQQFGQTSIIPPTGQWLLKEYDRDVTIPESDLSSKYPYIKQWYSKEGIQIGTLGRVLQIYGKIMPICGKCLRIEEKVGIEKDISLEQGVKEATKRPFEIFNAFELRNEKSDD